MIRTKVLQSLQNVHGIVRRWTERFLPNEEKCQSREILQLICHPAFLQRQYSPEVLAGLDDCKMVKGIPLCSSCAWELEMDLENEEFVRKLKGRIPEQGYSEQG